MKGSWFNWCLRALAVFGFLFLYIPILVLIIFSFNANERVTVWTGFSVRWYKELLQNDQIISAALNSFLIAGIAATLASVLGTLAAYVLERFGKFNLYSMLKFMVTSPLVMPEVITGFSLLMLFVTMENLIGWPSGRGLLTVILAHTTFCMAYVTVVVQSRLSDMDESLEEAAMDLGASPVTVFFTVTVPVISPAIVSGWLLAFTLSLDDLVIASFTNGPGSSTLPMVIFSKVRLGVSPDVNALAALMIATVAIGVGAAMVMMNRQKRSNPS